MKKARTQEKQAAGEEIERETETETETDREKRRFTNAHRAQRREKKQGSELTRSSASLLELSRSKLTT